MTLISTTPGIIRGETVAVLSSNSYTTVLSESMSYGSYSSDGTEILRRMSESDFTKGMGSGDDEEKKTDR